MMVFKTRKAYIEAVEMSMHNMDEIRDFCGVEYDITFLKTGWFTIRRHRDKFHAVYVKEGDYVIKTDNGIVCSIDKEDFHKLYKGVDED